MVLVLFSIVVRDPNDKVVVIGTIAALVVEPRLFVRVVEVLPGNKLLGVVLGEEDDPELDVMLAKVLLDVAMEEAEWGAVPTP